MRPALPDVEERVPAPVDDASSRRALIGTAGVLGMLAAAPLLGRLFRLGDAIASPSKAQDAKILQLVLQLEYTQVAFYEQALQHAGLKGDLHDFAQTALGHERQHLAAIQKALGAKAGPKPTFAFGPSTRSADAFVRATIKLEDIAVAGYNGQATNLTRGTLASAAEIVSVEARHAAWIRAIAGITPAPEASEPLVPAKRVMATLEGSGYVR